MSKTTPTPIRLSDDMQRRINCASEQMDLEKQELMRRALSLGLEVLNRFKYDPDSAVIAHLEQTGAWKQKPYAPKKARAAKMPLPEIKLGTVEDAG